MSPQTQGVRAERNESYEKITVCDCAYERWPGLGASVGAAGMRDR